MDALGGSVADWWELAGVDTWVDETPRDWLAPPPRRAAEAAAPLPAAASAPTTELPADLAALRTWLAADAAVPGRPAARLDAVGDPAGGAMVFVDMPEGDDRTARTLLAGDVGALFDRMLAAIGLDRATAYIAPFSPARPMAGALDEAAIARLLPLARHHLALVRPRRLLLMGEAPTRALLGLGTAAARGRVHLLDVAGTPTPTIATFPTRFVHQATAADDRKARRAMVWDDLQKFKAL